LISDFISDSLRTTALGAAMKGAGLAVRFLPIPQPTILVGPGASGRLGQTIAGFGHEARSSSSPTASSPSWACSTT
jgi:alcohol dehydrogenase